MAAMWKLFGSFCSSLLRKPLSQTTLDVAGRSQKFNQALTGAGAVTLFSRTTMGWTDWRMLKDHKRRMMVKEYALVRRRINCLRKNRIFPRALQAIADKEIDAFPRDSNRHRLVNRCSVTSRPRGVLRRWRVSRIVFRHLADYNFLSGCIRAKW